MNDLTNSQILRYHNEKKEMVLAYVLVIFLGLLGVHRFYLGYVGTGFIMLGLTLFGFIVVFTFFIAAIWVLVDLFLIPEMTKMHNRKLMTDLEKEAQERRE